MMMDKLRVRVYNVRFGDAVLVSVPDADGQGNTEMRHILVDVGNAVSGEGGKDALFGPVVRDVQEVLDGRPLDLYVMTHEHMDHVQGLFYASQKLGAELDARYAWLTASAHEEYYENHPEAKKQRMQMEEIYLSIASYLQAVPERETPWIRALMFNNNPRSTADCVSYLRGLAAETAYVHRGYDLTGTHPFQEAQFEILAPEEDTADYYGRFQPMALGVTQDEGARAKPRVIPPVPPAGVDAGAFYDLVAFRGRGFGDNLLAIDRAANNTSVVFKLEWRGWRLLFTGDAEKRSWKTMNKHVEFEPVHFLKVSHHGSHTGMPPDEMLDKLLPAESHEPRHAVVSAYPGTYNNVPDDETLAELEHRCELHSVVGLADSDYLDFEFRGWSQEVTVSESLG
jgi:beta-lactamase superfamily II metal-dependent hydrolase